MDVWEIVGYENVPRKNNPELFNVRLYVQREIPADRGTGLECNRVFYNPEYVQFVPELGARVVIVDGRFGVERILRVG